MGLVRVNKMYCPHCSTALEWCDGIDLAFDGDELHTIDIYTCNECFKDFEIQTEFAVTFKDYKIITELKEGE